jgi:hypothetical protein
MILQLPAPAGLAHSTLPKATGAAAPPTKLQVPVPVQEVGLFCDIPDDVMKTVEKSLHENRKAPWSFFKGGLSKSEVVIMAGDMYSIHIHGCKTGNAYIHKDGDETRESWSGGAYKKMPQFQRPEPQHEHTRPGQLSR